MRRVILKGLLAKKGRLVMTALAIVIGTAFLSATGVLSATIRSGAEAMFGESARNSDVEIRRVAAFSDGSGREPLPAAVVERVRATEGVDQAAGMVEGFAQLVDSDGEPIGTLTTRTLGASAAGIGTVSPFELRTGRAPAGPDEVALDVAAARAAGVSVGERVSVRFAGPTRAFTVVGTVGFGRLDSVAGSTYVLFDLPTAQAVLGRVGEVDEVLVSAAPGVSAAELVDRLQPVVGEGVEVQSSAAGAAERADNARRNLAVIDRALLAFALIALVVGSFIIVNTFTIVVAQRTSELALLRALGASQRQLRRSVMVEAAATGLLASAVGAVAGIGLAAGLRSMVFAFGLELPVSKLEVAPAQFVIPVVVGVAVTVAAAYVPARRAGRTSPIAAMHDLAPAEAGASRRRYIFAAVLGVVGLIGGMLGVPFLLAAVALLAPLVVPPLARVLAWPAVRFGGAAGKLGAKNAARNPRRTASTSSALMIGLALVVGVAVVGESALQSFSGALGDAVKADFAVYSHQVELSPELADRLRERPEIGDVSQMRYGEFALVGDSRVQSLTAIDPDNIGEMFDLGYSDGALARMADGGGMLVSKRVLSDRGWKVGDELAVRFARTGEQKVPIQGTYAEDALEDQGFLLALRDYEANYSDQFDLRVLVSAAPNVSTGEARVAIEEVTDAFPSARVDDRAGYVAEAKSQLDVVLALVTVLLGLAVIVAALGIVNTMALSIVERTREIGLLRSIGMSRRQLRAMTRWESVTIAMIGAVLGLAAGAQIASAIAGALDDMITSLAFPWARLAMLVVVAVLLGVASAVIPARRAARLNPLLAISHE